MAYVNTCNVEGALEDFCFCGILAFFSLFWFYGSHIMALVHVTALVKFLNFYYTLLGV